MVSAVGRRHREARLFPAAGFQPSLAKPGWSVRLVVAVSPCQPDVPPATAAPTLEPYCGSNTDAHVTARGQSFDVAYPLGVPLPLGPVFRLPRSVERVLHLGLAEFLVDVRTCPVERGTFGRAALVNLPEVTLRVVALPGQDGRPLRVVVTPGDLPRRPLADELHLPRDGGDHSGDEASTYKLLQENVVDTSIPRAPSTDENLRRCRLSAPSSHLQRCAADRSPWLSAHSAPRDRAAP